MTPVGIVGGSQYIGHGGRRTPVGHRRIVPAQTQEGPTDGPLPGNRRLGPIGRGDVRLHGRVLQRRRMGSRAWPRPSASTTDRWDWAAPSGSACRVGSAGHPARLPDRHLRAAPPGGAAGRDRHHPLGGHDHRGRPGPTAARSSPTTPTCRCWAPVALSTRSSPLLFRPHRRPGPRRPAAGARRRPTRARPPLRPAGWPPAWSTRSWRPRWWAASRRSGPRCAAGLAGWTTPPPMDGQVGAGHRGHLGAGPGHGRSAWPAWAPRVRFVARSDDRAERAVDHHRRGRPGADVAFLLADMGEFDQVRAPGRPSSWPTTTGSTSWSTTPGR